MSINTQKKETSADRAEIVQAQFSTSGTSDILMVCAIVPSSQTVNAAYYSQVDQRLRRYKNIIIV